MKYDNWNAFFNKWFAENIINLSQVNETITGPDKFPLCILLIREYWNWNSHSSYCHFTLQNCQTYASKGECVYHKCTKCCNWFYSLFCQTVASTLSVIRLNKCSLCNALIVVVVMQPSYGQTKANKCGKKLWSHYGIFHIAFQRQASLCFFYCHWCGINQNSLKY